MSREELPQFCAEEDRREAAEDAQAEADGLEEEAIDAAWKAMTPAQRRAVREHERLEELAQIEEFEKGAR